MTARFAKSAPPPVALLRQWIEESYRAVAPKRLIKELDAPAGSVAGDNR